MLKALATMPIFGDMLGAMLNAAGIDKNLLIDFAEEQPVLSSALVVVNLFVSTLITIAVLQCFAQTEIGQVVNGFINTVFTCTASMLLLPFAG